MSELTSKEVGEIFNVSPTSLMHWRQRGLVSIEPPRRQRRIGYRYRIADLLDFAKTLDSGYSERQVREWYAKRQQEPA